MGSRAAHEIVYSQALEGNTNSSLYGVTPAQITESNPKKRRRVSLPRIDVNRPVSGDTRSVLSADPRRESASTRVRGFASREAEPNDHITTSGHVRRSRKNGTAVPETQGAQFIQEPFSFPDRQIWLKTKPRQRRSAEKAVQETISPSQETPGEGETLSLAKHADHIAALIAQKRLENESRSFRERMLLQQRLHRGEEDIKDKLIAASHDELKRKMELSAQGIFEEKPPGEGRTEELTVTISSHNRDSQGPATSTHMLESTPVTQHDDHQTQAQSNHARASTVSDSASAASDSHRISEQSSIEVDEADFGVLEAENSSLMMPPTVYRQVQRTTTQSITLTTASAYPQPSNLYLAQPRFSNQRIYDTQLQRNEQFSAMQDWTAHMWRALPSTATPVLAHSTIILPSAHTPQQSISTDHAMRLRAPVDEANEVESAGVRQQVDAFVFSATAMNGSDISSFPRAAENSSMLARSVEDSQSEQASATSRSNRNMFTGKAREDMLVGNSNQYVEPERRRNMFSNRS